MTPEHTTTRQHDGDARRKGTIMLVSGDLDKALAAFEIATGFQSMGMDMSMWFVFYGANCLLKPRSRLSPKKWFGRLRGGPGRKPDTDVALQRIVRGLNPAGACHLPLSQLNFAGIGPHIIRRILRRKGIAQLDQLIYAARDLGVRFTLCQTCVDAMAIAVPDDLIVTAAVDGVSAYYLECAAADYNCVL